MKKNVLALLLAVLLTGGSMFACGTPAEQTDPAAETAAGETDTAAVETDYLQSLGERDFGGAPFRYLILRTDAIPLLNPPGEETTGEPMNDAQFNRDRKLMDLYNVVVEYPEYTDIAADLKNAVQAGDPLGDVYVDSLCDGLRNMGAAFTNGCLQDLNALPYLQLKQAWYSQLINQQLTYNDKLFFTSGDIAIASYIVTACVYMNLNLAEDYAIDADAVYEMVYDGSWTYDVLYGYYNGLDADMNGDGKIEYKEDFYGMVNETNDLTAALLLASCGVKMSEMEDGKMVVNMGSETVFNVVDKMNAYFDVVVGNELNTELYDNIYKNGRALFDVHYIESTIRRFRDMEDDYVILPMPKYDLSQKTYVSYINPWTKSFLSIPIVLEDPEKTAFITEAMAYESLQTVRPAVYDVTLKGKAARNEDCVAMIDIVFNTTYLDFNSIFNFGGSLAAARAGIFADAGYASEYAKIASGIEAALTDFAVNFE